VDDRRDDLSEAPGGTPGHVWHHVLTTGEIDTACARLVGSGRGPTRTGHSASEASDTSSRPVQCELHRHGRARPVCRLPVDCIITAENARCYKPRPEVYRTAISLLGLRPEDVMDVAAHNYDLVAARAEGMATAFVPRPLEYGPGQRTTSRRSQAGTSHRREF